MIEMSDVMISIERNRCQACDRLTANKPTIFAAMRAHQIPKVTIAYSGSGDSGCIDSVDAHRNDESECVDLAAINVSVVHQSSMIVDGKWQTFQNEKTVTLCQAFEEFAYDWLEANHGGWEINEGSDGEVVFDLEKSRVFITHNNHYMETDTHEAAL